MATRRDKECNIQIEFGAMPVRLPMQRGPRIAKPNVAVAERLLTAIGVNRHAGKPFIRAR